MYEQNQHELKGAFPGAELQSAAHHYQACAIAAMMRGQHVMCKPLAKQLHQAICTANINLAKGGHQISDRHV